MKRHLIIFGGFHDNPLREGDAKYFNDVHAFDTQEMKWKKLEISGVKPPSPRSGCNMFTTSDGRIVIYGGYSKEKVKNKTSGKKASAIDSSKEVGRAMDDMFLLVADKHDETLTKWRWHNVKQTGERPNARSGISSVAVPNSNKAFFFGGVNDEETNESDTDDDDDMRQGNFYSDLYLCSIENEKATWQKIELSGVNKDIVGEKKKRRGDRKDKQSDELKNQDDLDHSSEGGSDSEETAEQDSEATKGIERLEINPSEDEISQNQENTDCSNSTIRVVEDGAFTISSTIIHSESATQIESTNDAKKDKHHRGNGGITFKKGCGYIYGTVNMAYFILLQYKIPI